MNNIWQDFECEASNNDKYEINSIWNSVIYAKKLVIEQLSEFYYLVLWKNYSKE